MFVPFQYRALVMKMDWAKKQLVAEDAVYDGDTAFFLFDEGERGYRNPRCRFYGIDAPEMNDPDPAIRARAIAARDFVRSLIQGREVFVISKGLDKYGRRLPLIWVNRDEFGYPDLSLNQDLIKQKLAVRYMDEEKILKDVS